MTETRKTTRFALLFFLYFMGSSVALRLLPFLRGLSDSAYMLLAQLFSFLPPLILYFHYTKKDFRKTLRLNPLGWKNLLIILCFGVFVQPLMSLMSYITSMFFPNPVEQSVAGIQQSGLIISLISVAVLPAILEETFSRGILLSGYQFLGKWRAAFVSALLFGLLHMNPQQFLYAFVIGYIFAFLVERTNSLYAAILPHMIINGTSTISMFTEGAGTGPVDMEPSVILATLVLMVLMALPGLVFLLYLFLKLNPPQPELLLMDETGQVYRESFISPAMIIIFLLYIVCGILPYLSS